MLRRTGQWADTTGICLRRHIGHQKADLTLASKKTYLSWPSDSFFPNTTCGMHSDGAVASYSMVGDKIGPLIFKCNMHSHPLKVYPI